MDESYNDTGLLVLRQGNVAEICPEDEGHVGRSSEKHENSYTGKNLKDTMSN